MRGKIAKQIKRAAVLKLVNHLNSHLKLDPKVAIKRMKNSADLEPIISDFKQRLDIFHDLKKQYCKAKTMWKNTPKNLRHVLTDVWFKSDENAASEGLS